MVKGTNWLLAALCLASGATAATTVKQEANFEEGKRAYEASEYKNAIQALQAAAAKEPQNGDVQLLLTKSYLELEEHDPAIRSAERAVAIDRKEFRLSRVAGQSLWRKGGSCGEVLRSVAGKENAQRI